MLAGPLCAARRAGAEAPSRIDFRARRAYSRVGSVLGTIVVELVLQEIDGERVHVSWPPALVGCIAPRTVLDNHWTVVSIGYGCAMDPNELAHRQYLLGVLNRRMATHMEQLDDVFSVVTGEPGVLTLLCACGRADCERPLLRITSQEYDIARRSPHRFIISPDHTTEIDDVVHVGDGFSIVEIKPQYREDSPATSESI